MKYKELGKSGISASVVGMGTWAMGGGLCWGDMDDTNAIKTIKAGYDKGINLLDTAPFYGFGHSEEIVGKAIKEIGRDNLVISTKCGMWWKDDRGSMLANTEGHETRISLDPETIKIEIEDSLKRLDTDYIDIYFTHWQCIPPVFTPVNETMSALLELKKQGKIRAIGVSHADVPCMEEYFKTGIIDCCQPKYNLLCREIEQDIIPFAKANNMGVMSFSALEQGLLTGAITMDSKFEYGDVRARKGWIEPTNRIKVLNMLDGWKDLLAKYNCSYAQLVIACTLMTDGLTHILCGASNPTEALENAIAGEINLSETDFLRMRKDVITLGNPM